MVLYLTLQISLRNTTSFKARLDGQLDNLSNITFCQSNP